MLKVTYVESGGQQHVVDVQPGRSLMESAVQNGVPGIAAVCGGACACATCHIYIDEAWRSRIGARNDLEESMLEMADDVQANSRLACQIRMTDELDGLVVHVPDNEL
jgi:2Fe-2S ferredoxin